MLIHAASRISLRSRLGPWSPEGWPGTVVGWVSATRHSITHALDRPLHLFKPRTWSAKCWLERDGKVLLVRNVHGSGKWNLPGGGIEAVDGAAFRVAAGVAFRREHDAGGGTRALRHGDVAQPAFRHAARYVST